MVAEPLASDFKVKVPALLLRMARPANVKTDVDAMVDDPEALATDNVPEVAPLALRVSVALAFMVKLLLTVSVYNDRSSVGELREPISRSPTDVVADSIGCLPETVYAILPIRALSYCPGASLATLPDAL